MKIMLEQPSLLNAPTTPLDSLNNLNTPEMPDESQPSDFMNYLSSLLFNQQTADNAPSVDAEKLQTMTQDNTNTTQDENNNEALNNLLIEMSYLMNNTVQTEAVKPEDKLTGAASDALTMENKQINENKQAVNVTATTQTSIPMQIPTQMQTPTATTNAIQTNSEKPTDTRPTSEMVRLLTGDANVVKPAPSNALNQSIISENIKEMNKIDVKEKIETKPTIENLMTKTVTTKPTVEHEKLIKNNTQAQDQHYFDSLQNLSQWIQAKLNDKQVNNAIKLESQLNDQSVTGTGVASAPAKSAYEVNVSIEKSMSATDVNLTTYHANIKIYPPELGKITARLKLDKNNAELEVVAENRQVKALLETHIVALKEQFTSSNIQLDKINIVLQEPENNMTSNGKEKQQEKQAYESNENLMKGEATPKKTEAKQKHNTSANVDAYV